MENWKNVLTEGIGQIQSGLKGKHDQLSEIIQGISKLSDGATIGVLNAVCTEALRKSRPPFAGYGRQIFSILLSNKECDLQTIYSALIKDFPMLKREALRARLYKETKEGNIRRTGRIAKVWKITEAGRQVLSESACSEDESQKATGIALLKILEKHGPCDKSKLILGLEEANNFVFNREGIYNNLARLRRDGHITLLEEKTKIIWSKRDSVDYDELVMPTRKPSFSCFLLLVLLSNKMELSGLWEIIKILFPTKSKKSLSTILSKMRKLGYVDEGPKRNSLWYATDKLRETLHIDVEPEEKVV